jgi:hypothetical protein
MLPGFRFLFAAIVLSMSILVFGLGAAALLRAAHEQFASIPARRAPPEPVFAQQNEEPATTLALLRAEPPAVEKAPIDLPVASEPAAPTADATPPAEPEKLAALKPNDDAPAEAAKPEAPAADTTSATVTAPAEAEAAAASDETRLAAISEPAPPANEAAPAAIEPADAQVAPESSAAAMKIATLGGPEVTIAQPAAAQATDAKTDQDAARKRAQAQRLKERRRAARAQLSSRTIAQQPADPFAQPTITPAKR